MRYRVVGEYTRIDVKKHTRKVFEDGDNITPTEHELASMPDKFVCHPGHKHKDENDGSENQDDEQTEGEVKRSRRNRTTA